jgi:hypothetical protein
MKLYVKVIHDCIDCPNRDTERPNTCKATGIRVTRSIPKGCPLGDLDDGVRWGPPPAEGEGELMSLKDFVAAIKSTAITDDDGVGYFATRNWESNIEAIPSKLAKGETTQPWATHVAWYNK